MILIDANGLTKTYARSMVKVRSFNGRRHLGPACIGGVPRDIPLLADMFLQRLTPGVQPCTFSPDFYAAIQAWSWPGNVRQLDNVVQRLAAATRTGQITAADLPPEIQTGAVRTNPARPHERRRSALGRGADSLHGPSHDKRRCPIRGAEGVGSGDRELPGRVPPV
jgi:hypothetical protein